MQIRRRYSEFVRFRNHLKKVTITIGGGIKWPKLPPKVRLFKKSTSVVSARLVGLDVFLSAVIDRISSINADNEIIGFKNNGREFRDDDIDSGPSSIQKLRLTLLDFLDAPGLAGSHHKLETSSAVLMHRLYGARHDGFALQSNEYETSIPTPDTLNDVTRLHSGRETNRETRIIEQHIRLMSPEALAICVVIFSMVIGNFYQIMSIVDSSGAPSNDYA